MSDPVFTYASPFPISFTFSIWKCLWHIGQNGETPFLLATLQYSSMHTTQYECPQGNTRNGGCMSSMQMGHEILPSLTSCAVEERINASCDKASLFLTSHNHTHSSLD